MSPTINGRMFAELRDNSIEYNEFRVVILNADLHKTIEFTSELEVLSNYLETKNLPYTFSVHIVSNSNDNYHRNLSFVTICNLNKTSTDDVTEYAKENDIDLILDSEKIFSNKQIYDHKMTSRVTNDYLGLKDECEIFLVGKEVAWTFKNAMFNQTWLSRYLMREGLCRETFEFMGNCKELKGYSEEQQEKLRYLTNRLAHIEYCRDVLLSYIQKLKKAQRNDNNTIDHNHEFGYHLSNYYFLMAGGLDITARLHNSLYGLGLTSFGDLGLEKGTFIRKLSTKRPSLARIYKSKKSQKWMAWLKDRRNYIAHESAMSMSPLVKERDPPLTEKEIEALVDQQTDWTLMSSMLTPDLYEAQRQMVRNIVVASSYELIAPAVMTVKKGNKTRISFPLIDIQYDYAQYSNLIKKTIDHLKRQRKQS